MDEAAYEWAWIRQGDVKPLARDQACFVPTDDGDVYLLGGRAAREGNQTSGPIPHLRDLWRWDGMRWWPLDLGDGPECLNHHAAYHASLGKLIVIEPVYDDPVVEDGDIDFGIYFLLHWEWDGSMWTSRQIDVPFRFEHSVVYDPDQERLLLFGGVGWEVPAAREQCSAEAGIAAEESNFRLEYCWRDVWEFVDGQWRMLSNTCDESAPSCLEDGGAYFDATSRAVRVLNYDDRRTEIFEYAEEGWSFVAGSELSDVPNSSVMIYMDHADTLLTYPTQRRQEGPQSEMWAFTSRWAPFHIPAPGPAAEWNPALAYVPTTGEVLLFGGAREEQGPEGFYIKTEDDLWVLRPMGDQSLVGIGCRGCSSGTGSPGSMVWVVAVVLLVASRRRSEVN